MKKEIKGIQMGKEDIKLQFTDYIIAYVKKSPKIAFKNPWNI